MAADTIGRMRYSLQVCIGIENASHPPGYMDG
jgi:hypothetical protein